MHIERTADIHENYGFAENGQNFCYSGSSLGYKQKVKTVGYLKHFCFKKIARKLKNSLRSRHIKQFHKQYNLWVRKISI